MALIDDFKTRFPDPEFTTADVDRLIPILGPVYPHYYGGEYAGAGVEIVLNLLAHLMVDELRSGAGSATSTQSKSVGNVSISYKSSTQKGGADYDFFRTSKYGQRYWILIRSKRGAKFV